MAASQRTELQPVSVLKVKQSASLTVSVALTTTNVIMKTDFVKINVGTKLAATTVSVKLALSLMPTAGPAILISVWSTIVTITVHRTVSHVSVIVIRVSF